MDCRRVLRSRPLRIVFPNSFVVKEILKNKTKLRSINDFRNIYLKSDDTPYQRDLLAKCKESLKAREMNGETKCKESLKAREMNGEMNLKIKYFNGVPQVVAQQQENNQ
ncbi:hypothetical protein QE152_g3872 [Popillia japonica]|uniref:Uncharacterized protein n=1 Tax=Popillia japonica TaxID=7064 RepID=A0AAW1N372_POPJA